MAKLDPNGILLWIKSFGGPDDDESGGLIVSNNKKLTIVGSVRKNPDFIDTLIISDNRCKPFVGTFDMNGNLKNIKLWYSDLYFAGTDTIYSHVKCVEPVMDTKGNIYAIWKLCYIKINTEIGYLYGGPTDADYFFILIKIDSLSGIDKCSGLGLEWLHDFWGLKLDNYDNPYLLMSSWSQYTGSGVTILGFDTLLKYTRSLYAPFITDLPGCNYRSKALKAIDFDENNNILAFSHDECNYYGSPGVPAGDDMHLVIHSIDTSGNQLSNKKYNLGNSNVQPSDIIKGSYANSFYTIGYAFTGFKFETDSVVPHSIYVAKYSSSTTPTDLLTINNLSSTLIYPNPCDGILNVKIESNLVKHKTKLELKTVFGQTIYIKEIENQQNNNAITFQIDLSAQPKGIYFMEIISDGERVVKKIVLQ
jgi:hypothetical protein